MTWKQGFVLETIQLDQNHISYLVVADSPQRSWMISCVYAPHTLQCRSAFWSHLTNLDNSFGGARHLLGDFNAILSFADKCGGRSFGSTSHNDFSDFVRSNALVDLGFVGNKFT